METSTTRAGAATTDEVAEPGSVRLDAESAVRSGALPADRPPRTWPAALWSMAVVGAIATMLFARNHRYFFLDDRQSDAIPKLIDISRILQSGEWPWLSTNAVNSGAHAVEYQNGVFNPAHLAFGYLLSQIGDLALGSFIQILAHLLLLTGAAAWLGRLLGLSTPWAVAFAVSVGLQPYTIFWGAGWFQAVASFSFFVLAVAAAVAFHQRPRRRYGWLLLVAAYCSNTAGWPLAIPMLGLVVVVLVAARLLTGHDRRQTAWLGAWYAGGAVVSLIALVPLFTSFQFASRNSSVTNLGNFQVIPVEGLLQSANPTYWPWFHNFGGYALQELPFFYVAWFVLPVLVLWKRGTVDATARVLLLTAVTLLGLTAFAALGPERLLVFRFPSRFGQYVGFFLLVTVALLVARGRFSYTRARLAVLLGLVLVLVLGSLQADPLGARRILPLGVVLGVLCWGFWWTRAAGPAEAEAPAAPAQTDAELDGRPPRDEGPGTDPDRRRLPGAAAGQGLVVAGTVLVLAWLAWVHPMGRGLDWGMPHDASVMQRLSADDYTLFYGNYPPLEEPDELPSPAPDVEDFYRVYHPSGMGLVAGNRQINGYSPLGHRFFREHFPIDDQGNFADSGAEQFAAVDPSTGATWLELFRVDQVISLLGPRDEQLREELDGPWQRVDETEHTAVYQRPGYDLPGLVSHVDPGVEASAVERDCPWRHSRECVRVAAGDDEARVVFARLWFPGYSASLDGEPLEVRRHDGVLVAVDVPAGAEGVLEVRYRSPGFVPTSVLALVSLAGLVIASALVPQAGGASGAGRARWSRVRRRRRSPVPSGEADRA
jgi:hypothetical protein